MKAHAEYTPVPLPVAYHLIVAQQQSAANAAEVERPVRAYGNTFRNESIAIGLQRELDFTVGPVKSLDTAQIVLPPGQLAQSGELVHLVGAIVDALGQQPVEGAQG